MESLSQPWDYLQVAKIRHNNLPFLKIFPGLPVFGGIILSLNDISMEHPYIICNSFMSRDEFESLDVLKGQRNKLIRIPWNRKVKSLIE